MKKYIELMFWQFSALKYLVLGLVVLVPLYFNTSHLFPFETPKVLIVIIGSIVAGGLYLWGRARERESVLVISWGHVALSLFVAVVVISGLNAVVPRFAFFGAIDGDGIILLCAYAILASIIGHLVQKDKQFIKTLISFSVATAVLVTLISYFNELLSPDTSDGSTLGNTSYLGPYLLVNVCLAIGLFLVYKRVWQRTLIALAGLFIVTSPVLFNTDILKGVLSLKDIIANPFLLSGSANGAVLGLGVAILAIASLFLFRSRRIVWQWAGAIALIGILLGIYVAGQSFMNPSSPLHQTYVAEKSANRFLFWDIASTASGEKPFLGWGMNGYSYAFQEHFSPLFFSPGYVPELWTDNPHNMFKEYQVNTGIIGLMGYLVLVGTTGIILFICSRSEDKTEKVISIVLFGALLGYVIQNLFVFDTVVPLLMFYIIIGYAIGVSGFKSITISSEYKTPKIVLSIIVGAFLIYALVVAGIEPWQESKKWSTYTEKNTIPLESTPQLISKIGYTADTAVLGQKFFEYIRDNNVQWDKIAIEEKNYYLKTFEILTKNMEEEMVLDGRDNFRAHWIAGRLYIQTIVINKKIDTTILEKAQKHLTEAISINPTNPLPYYDMVQVMLFEKDIKGVLSWTRASIALAPEYRGGYLLAEKVIKSGIADEHFIQYVTSMKDTWCPDNSLCAKGEWR